MVYFAPGQKPVSGSVATKALAKKAIILPASPPMAAARRAFCSCLRPSVQFLHNVLWLCYNRVDILL